MNVTLLSLQRPGVEPGPVHVEFVVDEGIVGQIYLRLVCFFPVSIIPPKFDAYHPVQSCSERKDKPSKPGDFTTKVTFFRKLVNMKTEKYCQYGTSQFGKGRH